MSKKKKEELSSDIHVSKKELEEFLFGKTSVDFVSLDDDVEYFSTGNITLDILLGGGWSRGRIHLLKGRESVSKSRLMASVCFIETIFYNNIVLVIDYEGTWTKDWLSKIFVDLEKVIIVRPETAEESFNIVDKAIKSGRVSSIIIDSIASMTTIEEYNKSHEESTQASLARQLSKFCRKSTASLNSIRIERLKNKDLVLPTIFLVNQIRTNLHARFNNEMLPGGQAQKNASTVILDLFRTTNIEDSEGDVMGFFINAKTEKNKLGVPFRTAQFGLINNELGYLGHPRFSFFHGYDLFLLGKNFGIIKQSGAWYEVDKFGKFQGEANIIKSIIENDEISKFLLEKIKEKVLEYSGSEIMFNHEIFLKSLGR
ncbi:MAG: protein RecA [Candidatus Sericytochromatia bacterium]|nr:MAG: protein RecA [Candidatus Sericytochromatia bacterium]